MTDPAVATEDDDRFEELVKSQLPLSRVKKIAKIDPNVNLLTSESIKLMAKGTEGFIGLLAKAAYTQAVLDKRRTIQPKDINTVIKQSPVFAFLQGALDDWPEPEKVDRTKSNKENVEEGEDGDTADDNDDDHGDTEEVEDVVEAENDEQETENEVVPDSAEATDSLPDTVPPSEESPMEVE